MGLLFRQTEEMIQHLNYQLQEVGSFCKAPAPPQQEGDFPVIQVQDGSLPLPPGRTQLISDLFLQLYWVFFSGPKRKEILLPSSTVYSFGPIGKKGQRILALSCLVYSNHGFLLKPGHQEGASMVFCQFLNPSHVHLLRFVEKNLLIGDNFHSICGSRQYYLRSRPYAT